MVSGFFMDGDLVEANTKDGVGYKETRSGPKDPKGMEKRVYGEMFIPISVCYGHSFVLFETSRPVESLKY